MISAETVKSMTHRERMDALGRTVTLRIAANDLIVAGMQRNDHERVTEGKRVHDAAARDARVLRY